MATKKGQRGGRKDRPMFSLTERERILSMRERGFSIKEIASELKRSISGVWMILAKANAKPPPERHKFDYKSETTPRSE